MGEDRRQVLTEVSQLITGGNMQMQMIGCSILSALMAEYATTVKSSDVGLAWEIHFKAKKQFELTDLKSIFTFCVQALKGKLPLRLFLFLLLWKEFTFDVGCQLGIAKLYLGLGGLGDKLTEF